MGLQSCSYSASDSFSRFLALYVCRHVAADDRYLLSAGCLAVNPSHAAATVDRWDRRTNRRTDVIITIVLIWHKLYVISSCHSVWQSIISCLAITSPAQTIILHSYHSHTDPAPHAGNVNKVSYSEINRARQRERGTNLYNCQQYMYSVYYLQRPVSHWRSQRLRRVITPSK